MRCMACDVAEVSERPELTPQRYRRSRAGTEYSEILTRRGPAARAAAQAASTSMARA